MFRILILAQPLHQEKRKSNRTHANFGGRLGTRTPDLFRVKEAL